MTKPAAKPFVKWAGGKSQLLTEINNVLPASVKKTKYTYIEPFVGGGAVLFWILQRYPNIKKAVVNDKYGLDKRLPNNKRKTRRLNIKRSLTRRNINSKVA